MAALELYTAAGWLASSASPGNACREAPACFFNSHAAQSKEHRSPLHSLRMRDTAHVPSKNA